MNIINMIQGVSRVFGVFGVDTGYDDAIKAMKLKDSNIELLKSNGNMVNLLAKYVVTPTIFVSEDSYSRKDIDTVLKHTTDVYAAMYLQVFKVLVNVHEMTVNEALSVMSTSGLDVESIGEPLSASNIDAESMVEGVYFPKLDSEDVSVTRSNKIVVDEDNSLIEAKSIVRTVNITVKANASSVTTLAKGGDHKSSVDVTLEIPIVIKARVLVYPMKTIINSVKHRGMDSSFFSRLIKYNIGMISAGNLITGNDLADAYKKGTLSKDNFSSVLNKASVNHLSVNDLINKNIGVNKTVFNYIITDDEAKLLTREMGLKLDGREGRELLNAMLAFNLTTINEDRDMVSVYVNGISGSSDASIKKLSKDKGGDGATIELLANAMLANRPF